MGIIVKPWKRGSRKRLYVKESDTNQTIGWIDPDSLNGELCQNDRSVEFVAALFKYNIPREATIKIVADTKPYQNVDLSLNRPGDAAFQKAEELTQGMSKSHAEIIRSLGYGSVEQTWIQGAEGERLVGLSLEKNLPNWRIIHSVPIGDENSDIDHLVISPQGVFSINTKNHPGSTITCAENKVRVQGKSMGKNQPYARNSRFEAKRASKILSNACDFPVPVTGIVAYIALELNVMSNPKDGKVIHLNADHLVNWLKHQPQVFTARTASMIFEKAKWSKTWKQTR